MVNVEETIISQYATSRTLVKIVQHMNRWIDPTANFDDFYNWVWNITTAQGFGLDIWGRIIGVSREVFAGTVYEDDDEAYRNLLYVKALANITRTTSPALNQLLRNWLGATARAYVNDYGGMTMRYMFEFRLQAFQVAIVAKAKVFPTPGGVSAKLVHTSLPVFGFREMGQRGVTPFNVRPFIAKDAVYAIE